MTAASTARSQSRRREREQVARHRWVTVGQMAEAAGVAARTVAKMFDKGLFPGGWRLDGGRDRRIPVAAAAAFLRARAIPVPAAFADAAGTEEARPTTAAPAGAAIVADTAAGRVELAALAKVAKALNPAVRLLLLGGEDTPVDHPLTLAGWELVPWPATAADVARRLKGEG